MPRAPASAPGLIERSDSALFVIDVQDGFLARLPVQARLALVGRIRFIVALAQQLQIPTLVTVEDPARNGATEAEVRSALPSHALELDKRVFGLMGQTSLAERATALGRRTAVLVGLETDVCVLHSAVGLTRAGWRALLVEDACGAPGAAHAAGVRRARDLGVETIHAKGLYYEWLRTLEDVTRIAANPSLRPPPDLAL